MKRISVLIAALMVSLHGYALAPEITAKVDSGNLLMGKIGMLHLQVVLDRGQDLKLPILESATQDGLMPLIGDTVELRHSIVGDTVSLGGKRIQINLNFPMQAFVPGTYMLPSITAVVDNDTVKSQPLALSVTGPDVQVTDSISPDVGPVAPYYNKSSIEKTTDKVPDLIYYYWWIILLVILIVAGLVWYFIKHPLKKVPWLKPKPESTPYERAMERLRILRSTKLAETGEEKEYYSELTDILRQYLWGRFGINALEMTTQQIRNAVRNSSEAKVGKQYIENVLGMADFVKFAKFKPLPDDNIKAFEDVLNFVEQTKPVVSADEKSSERPESKSVKQEKKSES